MNKFTLSLPAEKVLASTLLSDDGKAYRIDPDFRVVLGCFRKLADPDIEPLAKALYVAANFFMGNPPADMGDLFRAFALSGDGNDNGPALMDFEVDAEAIYAGFRQQYGIDLLREKLHWFEFRALLAGLCEETEYRKRIKIRQMRPEDVAEKNRSALREMQDAIAIAPRISKREQELQAELDRRLAAGEDPVEIIKQLQEV